MNDESTNTYSIGDVVQHKASGEKGIIIHVYEGACNNPEHKAIFDCVKNSSECKREYIDCYDISVSFEKIIEKIEGLLLEKEDIING